MASAAQGLEPVRRGIRETVSSAAGRQRRPPRWLFNLYPPFLGAGIRVRISPQWDRIEVRMELRWWNRNYVGTHYGGSLYSMCDPFYMLLLIERLGSDYIVWDKAAAIRFLTPGRGTVRAQFALSEQQVEAIRGEADREGRTERTLTVEVTDEAGEAVARVEKTIYVRRRAGPAAEA